MIVTGIEEISRSRSRVFLDEEFAFVLYKGELRLYHVRVGEELSQRDFDTIRNEVLPKRAKLRAMNLLKSRAYTTKQLHDKLKMGDYPEDVIELALAYVAEYHYTDDLRYAVEYITAYESTRSRRRIEQDLLGKGISREALEEAWQKWEEQGGSLDEEAMLQKLLRKRGFDPENTDERELRRLYGFLLRKGFSGEQIRSAIHHFAQKSL